MSPSAELTPPAWVDAAESAVLSTLRQEKKAWWTCSACPQPTRYLDGYNWYAVHSVPTSSGVASYRYAIRITESIEWELAYHIPEFQWLTVIRCKSCNRKRDRHHRAVRSLRDVLDAQMIHMGTSARFVTLTVPNEIVPLVDGVLDQGDLARLVRELKSKMYRFSRTVAYQDKVIGAVEFYEQTYTILDDGVDVNTHIHAVWLGQYWDQADLQSAWQGIVHLTKPRSRKAVLRYISKYVTKDPVPGTRAKETRGVLRG